MYIYNLNVILLTPNLHCLTYGNNASHSVATIQIQLGSQFKIHKTFLQNKYASKIHYRKKANPKSDELVLHSQN